MQISSVSIAHFSYSSGLPNDQHGATVRFQLNVDAVLGGSNNINDVITAVEPRIWNVWTVLPILQDTAIVAAGPSVCRTSACPGRFRWESLPARGIG